MSQWTVLCTSNMLITGTCLPTQFQGTKITDDLPKINISFVACATFLQPRKQAQLFGGDRGRQAQAPLMLCKPRLDVELTLHIPVRNPIHIISFDFFYYTHNYI
jgi:hypothetical protein